MLLENRKILFFSQLFFNVDIFYRSSRKNAQNSGNPRLSGGDSWGSHFFEYRDAGALRATRSRSPPMTLYTCNVTIVSQIANLARNASEMAPGYFSVLSGIGDR